MDNNEGDNLTKCRPNCLLDNKQIATGNRQTKPDTNI